MKTNSRNHLRAQADMHATISNIVPHSEKLITGFPRSWKIIENPGKINFPGNSWKSHGKLIKIRKSSKNKKSLKVLERQQQQQFYSFFTSTQVHLTIQTQ